MSAFQSRRRSNGMTVFYPAVIEKAKHGYAAYVADLPGCTSAGDTIMDAARNIAAAAQIYVSTCAEHGEKVPAPSESPEEPDHAYAAMVLVPVELPGKAERVNVTFETSVLAAIDRKAEAVGLNRSAFLAMAALKEGGREKTVRGRAAAAKSKARKTVRAG